MEAKYPQETINLAYKSGAKYLDERMSHQQITNALVAKGYPQDLSEEVSSNIIIMRKQKALKSSNEFLAYGIGILVLGVVVLIAQIIFNFGFIFFSFGIISISLFVLLFGLVLRINTKVK
jgi:hypothetical protein